MKKMSRVTFCALLLCLVDRISAGVIDEARTKGRRVFFIEDVQVWNSVIKIWPGKVIGRMSLQSEDGEQKKFSLFSAAVNCAT